MPKTKIYYNLSTAQRQLFCFPPDVIKYMIKNAYASQWLKLIKSCKYFYAKHRVSVLQNAILDEQGTFVTYDHDTCKQWTHFPEKYTEFLFIEKLNIASSLSILKPNIYKCVIRHLCISKIDVEFEDFKFLTASKLFNSFEIHNANIVNSDKSIVQLEDIFAALPYVSTFIQKSYKYLTQTIKSINPQTFQRMAEVLRYQMLRKLELTGIEQNGNANDFVKFIKNNADNNCEITLRMNLEDSLHFQKIVDEMLKKWKPQFAKPSIEFKNWPQPYLKQHHVVDAICSVCEIDSNIKLSQLDYSKD